MTSRAYWWTVAIGGVAVALGLAVFGRIAEAKGFALGEAGTAVSLGGWKLLLGMMGRWNAESRVPKLAAAFVLLVFFCKLPLFLLAARCAYLVGEPAPGWFLWGLGWVYSALVGWAAIYR